MEQVSPASRPVWRQPLPNALEQANEPPGSAVRELIQLGESLGSAFGIGERVNRRPELVGRNVANQRAAPEWRQ
jgi:hypothetical protein